MKRLTTKGYWDGLYTNTVPRQQGAKSSQPKRLWKRLLVKLLGGWTRDYTRSYLDYLLWDVLYRKYLPDQKGLKVLEIGSAPGLHLVRLMYEFGYVPYGVEYSAQGVELNRRVFADNGIDPENVIHADAFSEEFLSEYKEFFDIVISLGFIEHFTDVEKAVGIHLELLKPGGTLVVEIPNLSGINRLLLRLANRELLNMHSLSIMNKAVFRRLFDIPGLSPLYCNYCGTFSFRLWTASEKSLLRFPVRFCKRLEPYIGVVQRLIFRDRGLECRLWSPLLIFVGRKR